MVEIAEHHNSRALLSPAKSTDEKNALDALLTKLAHLNLERKINNTSAKESHGGYSDVFIGSCKQSDGAAFKVAVKRNRSHIMEDKKLHNVQQQTPIKLVFSEDTFMKDAS